MTRGRFATYRVVNYAPTRLQSDECAVLHPPSHLHRPTPTVPNSTDRPTPLPEPILPPTGDSHRSSRPRFAFGHHTSPPNSRSPTTLSPRHIDLCTVADRATEDHPDDQ